MEDLQDQMSRLMTRVIPDEGDSTAPSGGAAGAQQSQPQDRGDASGTQSNQGTSGVLVPSIKLSKVDGNWRVERSGRLARVGDTWVRQPLEKVDSVNVVKLLRGLNSGSNYGIRQSLRSKEGAALKTKRALEERKLQDLSQGLQRLQLKLGARKLAHVKSKERTNSN